MKDKIENKDEETNEQKNKNKFRLCKALTKSRHKNKYWRHLSLSMDAPAAVQIEAIPHSKEEEEFTQM
jgi:hypothetical protein